MASFSRHSNGSFNDNKKADAFLKDLGSVVKAHLTNEQFGVEELAKQMNMSRSNLHRRLKQASGQSVNQFIREYRLQSAIRLLQQEDINVSEVAYRVGFSSPSYFSTCFTEYFGYPPGEAKSQRSSSPQSPDPNNQSYLYGPRKLAFRNKKAVVTTLISLGVVLVVFSLLHFFILPDSRGDFAPRKMSIAILPFKNLDDDHENTYFVAGLVEATNRHLSYIKDLKVISLTSTSRYRESFKSAREIGRELGVNYLLEGSVQRHLDDIRIEVRLVDANTEAQVWAGNYDRQLNDFFNVQTDIARSIASTLKLTISPDERSLLNRRMTHNGEAYDLYLKGIYESSTYTRDGINRSRRYFEQSVMLDSGFALGYSGIASSYIAQAAVFGAELNCLDAFAKAKPMIDKALELDPGLPEARTWNAFYLLYNSWDFEGAEREYKKSLTGNSPNALALYADFLNFSERHDEALSVARQLDEMFPYYPNTRMVLSLYYTGNHEEAEKYTQLRMRMFKNYYILDSYGFLLLNTGKYDEAIEVFENVIDIEKVRYPRILGWMGAAYARSGNIDKAGKLIDELKTQLMSNDAGSIRFFIAIIYNALGDKPSALHWIRAAYEHHEMEMPWLTTEPQFRSLHQHAEFQDLVEKIGFPR